jgi:peptide/nickel transport system permease protein
MAGGITRDTCDTVVGPNKLPGFFRPETPERRYQNATKKFLSKVNRALAAEDVDVALKEVELGPFRVAEKSPAELKSVISQINAIADDLDQSPNLDDDPSLLPQLAELESVESQLKAPLGAWERFVYNAAICLGTDAQGRSIFFRGIYSIKIAIQIGLVTALFSVALGAFLGAAAGYFGGWVDHAVVWVYTTFSSIPNLVLLVVLAYAFTNSAVKDTLLPVYIAFGATFWIGTCRVIRGETLKLKEMEYVHAAQTAGFGPMHILLRHIIPNTAHLMLINFSLLLIAAIKSEVILSFLGFGVKNQPSWGIMIRDAGNNGDVIKGFFWEIGFATALMFVLVLAFNILSDALQDAFDPKHV